ncbi:MAG TPA: NAD(P)/FAD-dependent oxidoreductase [Thermoleophilaceae bacterium]|nr:NAD(P)/FAD-dependent oxidoreductase [Thermoleophilaceae bacterium]
MESGNGGAAFDAIVVGGGHNGLTCGAYLARAGLRVCVLERRHVLGGACVTEELWPGQRVSRASYVVSMLQPKVVADLRLRDHGYDPLPLDPSYATFGPDGRPIFFAKNEALTLDALARYSKRDAAAYPGFEELLQRAAGFLRPLLLRPPPALGSKRPGDLLGLLREAGRAAGLARRDIHELFRVMTMSVGDLLDDWFETDALKGAIGSTGVVGVWAGPRTPGTAYNLLHHALGELDGVPGAWGHVRGGMGAISQAIARSAESHGAVVRTDAAVSSIDVSGGRTTGVTLDSGEELHAPVVISGAHPRTTVLELVGEEHFPDEVGDDMRRYRSRGGSVKINCILSEPPRYENVSPEEAGLLLHTGVAICRSLDQLERAWQDAARGEPAAEPYMEVEVPTSVDPSLTDDGTSVMTMFTQYGPHSEEGWPEGAREAYAERCFEALSRHAPNVREALVHYEVLAPPDLDRIFGLSGGSIFQGEQGLDQMAFMRPSPLLAQYATPVNGLYLCGSGTHPGGGVMGACGHNAAQRILRDRRRQRFTRKLVRASSE